MTKVLIVEDEPPISNLIRLSLTKNGYACKCVFDGMEAADFLEKERTDLIPVSYTHLLKTAVQSMTNCLT